MKSLPTLLLCLATALAGAGLGWLLRSYSRPAAPGAAAAVSAASGSANFSPPAPAGRRSSAGESAYAAALSAQQSEPLRWLYLLGAAETATAGEMPALVRAAKDLPGVLSLLATRWVELDPQHMFDTLHAEWRQHRGGPGDLSKEDILTSALCEEWPKQDAAAAISALSRTNALPLLNNLRITMMRAVIASDVPAGIKLLKEWNITSFTPGMQAVGAWVKKDPQAAAETIFENASGSAASHFTRELGKEWAALDPAAALAFAGSRPGLRGSQLAASVMEAWAQRDFKAAQAYVNTLTDPRLRAQLGRPMVEAWAKTDPQAALLWANDHLKSEARAAAAGDIVRTLAAANRPQAAEFIAGMECGSGKDRAIRDFMDTWLDDDWFNGGDKKEATAALEWMAALPEAESRHPAMESIAWRLFGRAPEETIAFLQGPHGAAAPPKLMQQAVRHLAQSQPATAMQWADELPESHRAEARRGVLDEWLIARPDAAQQWTLALPPGDERRNAIRHVTEQLSWQNAALTAKWIASLPAAERPVAKAAISISPDLPPDRRAALEALVK